MSEPRAQSSGFSDLRDLSSIFVNLSGLYGTGRTTTSTSTSPEADEEIDRQLAEIMATNDSAYLDNLVANIMSRAKQEFAPIIGQSLGAGERAYTSTVVQQLANESMARATAAAAEAQLNFIANQQRTAASLANTKAGASKTENKKTKAAPGATGLNAIMAGLTGYSLFNKTKSPKATEEMLEEPVYIGESSVQELGLGNETFPTFENSASVIPADTFGAGEFGSSIDAIAAITDSGLDSLAAPIEGAENLSDFGAIPELGEISNFPIEEFEDTGILEELGGLFDDFGGFFADGGEVRNPNAAYTVNPTTSTPALAPTLAPSLASAPTSTQNQPSQPTRRGTQEEEEEAIGNEGVEVESDYDPGINTPSLSISPVQGVLAGMTFAATGNPFAAIASLARSETVKQGLQGLRTMFTTPETIPELEALDQEDLEFGQGMTQAASIANATAETGIGDASAAEADETGTGDASAAGDDESSSSDDGTSDSGDDSGDFFDGGIIPIDSVTIKATPGEIVIPVDTVQKMGKNFFLDLIQKTHTPLRRRV